MDNSQDSNHHARVRSPSSTSASRFYAPNLSNVLTAIRIANYIQQDIGIKTFLTTRIPIPIDYNSYSNSHPLRFDSHSDPPFAPFAKFVCRN